MGKGILSGGDLNFRDVLLGPIGSAGWDYFDLGGDEAEEERNRYIQAELARRQQQKQMQIDLLGRKQAPVMAKEMETRLKALDAESQPGALVTDPEFQGQRARLVTGGRQALASVQNKQKGYGIGGGFENTGSMQNIYDRMGEQLGALGQKQTERKEAKRDTVAQARQAFADAQTQHQNALVDARIAIEAGDAAALNDAYSRIYAAQVQSDQARKGMMMGVGTAALGALVAGPVGAIPGATQAVSAQQQQPTGYSVGQSAGMYGNDPFGVGGTKFKPTYQLRGGR